MEVKKGLLVAAAWTVLLISIKTTDATRYAPMTDIKKVHIVSMNHLDVGYASFINVIMNEYFTQYFDRAVSLANELRDGGYMETFSYTTHPWLVSLYLDCPQHLTLANVTLKCPSSTQLGNFTAAIKRGDITWHAGPMNMQIENMDQSLLEFGIKLGDDLDKRFNISRKFKTLSQRDVPGMTQAIIPTLVKMGVAAVSVGVNPMTSPPAVPNPFVWKFGGDSVIGTWHKGGYPNNPGINPKNPGGISRNDCTIVDGLSEVLCFAFRTDNSGPPESIQEILAYYEILRAEFPGAHLQASSFEDYMAALSTVKDKLPVVSMEIGDTWIQGIASDPRKNAEYRAVRRVFSSCLKSGNCSLGDARIYNASRFLLKPGEHTWGLPTVRDSRNWSNVDFTKARKGGNYYNCTQSWLEQRNMTYIAIEALKDHPVLPTVMNELLKIRPAQPNLSGFKQVLVDPASVYSCAKMTLSFSMQGAISKLVYDGKQWASPWNQLAVFKYITYNQTDFDKFGTMYNYNGGSAGYTKYNVTMNAHPESRDWPVSLDAFYQIADGGCDFYGHLKTVDSRPRKYYGAPVDMWIRYTVRSSKIPGIDITFQWFDKTSTRLPEALILAFNPAPQHGHRYSLSKVGQLVDPTNVILNGSQYQHAVDEGFYYVDQSMMGMKVTTLDVPIACISTNEIRATVFPAPLQPININITGISFNFYNNIWDTNYILWYPYLEEDSSFKARFAIDFMVKEN